MAFIKIGVFNQSTVLTDDEVRKMIRAIQRQVKHDFAPIWGIDADLIFMPKDAPPRSNLWHIILFDNADQAGVLGYHDITPEGLPLGKVFVQTTLNYGGKISVTLSHEVLEMLVDPDVNLIAQGTDNSGNARLYAYEVCDAVEADNLGYDIYGVTVSDFVTPAWFESFRKPGSTKFSFKEHVSAPFQLAAGGYIGMYDPYHGWSQLTARSNYGYGARPNPGSRRERRRTPRDQWMKSLKPWA